MRNGKADKAVYITLVLLLAAVAVLAFFNSGDRELKRALEEKREFLVCLDGECVAIVDLQTVLDLDQQEFTTSFATSVAAQRDSVMRGVELRALLKALDIDLSLASRVTVSGLDGYYSPLTREEVEREGTVYICYSMDGKILAPQSKGGYGPFMMVIRNSRFAQRWCNYLGEVRVEG